MTNAGQPIGEDDLQAFVDERLPLHRWEAVEAFLSEHPQAAEKVAAYRAHRRDLRARLAFKAEEPTPARLRVASIAGQRSQANRRRLAAIVMVAVWLALGGALGWFGNTMTTAVRGLSPASGSAMVGDAVSAHRTFVVEVTHPVEIQASDEVHLIQWLSKRLGRPLTAPDLTGLGYRLMGGRLLPADRGAAAQLMYDDDSGHRVTLYIRAGELGETAIRIAQHGDVAALYWSDIGLDCVVVGAINRNQLMSIGQAIYHQFERT